MFDWARIRRVSRTFSKLVYCDTNQFLTMILAPWYGALASWKIVDLVHLEMLLLQGDALVFLASWCISSSSALLLWFEHPYFTQNNFMSSLNYLRSMHLCPVYLAHPLNHCQQQFSPSLRVLGHIFCSGMLWLILSRVYIGVALFLIVVWGQCTLLYFVLIILPYPERVGMKGRLRLWVLTVLRDYRTKEKGGKQQQNAKKWLFTAHKKRACGATYRQGLMFLVLVFLQIRRTFFHF